MKRIALVAYYDDETGEMTQAEFSPAFTEESFLMRADVLQDIAHFVNQQYEQAAQKAFSGFRRRNRRNADERPN